eukprot:403360459
MLQVLQTRSLQLLETIVNTLDSYDEIKKRPRRFAKKDQDEDEQDKQKDSSQQKYQEINSDDDVENKDNKDQSQNDVEGTEKFKHLSFELIDIGLFFTEKGLQKVQQTRPYQVTDKYIHYEERAKQVLENSEKIYRFMNDKVYSPLKTQFYVIYDKTTNIIQVFVKVLKEHQEKVADYIRSNYENVKVVVQDNWLRLDYNQDGKVSVTDFRKSVQELYTFMINYNYYLRAHEIKNKLYHEAIKYMQKELDKEEREKESHVEEGGSTPAKEDDDDIMSD